MSGNQKKYIAIHFIVIALFLSIPVISSPDFDYSLSLFYQTPFLKHFVTYILILVFFYIHSFWVIPKFYPNRLTIQYLAIILVYFIGIILIENYAYPFPDPPSINFHPNDMRPFEFRRSHFPHFEIMQITSTLVPYILIIMLSHFIHLTQVAKKIELDKYRSELQNIQYQLQPHFLFNSLNNIYSISIIEPEKTPEYIIELSEILRYILNLENKKYVSLKDEIKFYQQYIHLQQLRHGNNTKNWELQWPSEKNIKELKIVPLIYLPIVENVFKYGIHPEHPSPIQILIDVDNYSVKIKTYNKKFFTPKDSHLLNSQQLGLSKTKERLELLYKGYYQLTVNESENEFNVELTINLHNREV